MAGIFKVSPSATYMVLRHLDPGIFLPSSERHHAIRFRFRIDRPVIVVRIELQAPQFDLYTVYDACPPIWIRHPQSLDPAIVSSWFTNFKLLK